jgi:uncharacterized protein (DUF1501 family)
MLDPDISTADALRHLSTPVATDRISLDRRRFLQMVGAGMGAGVVAGTGGSLLDSVLPGHDPSAWALGPVGPNDGILLVIGMYGGNDGLNTVVPINDGLYRDQHGALAVPAEETLPLDANSGLHPNLTALKQFWDADQLAIVEGVGHTDTDEFSHFNSMAKWMSGKPSGVPSSGWVGRWLDGYLGSDKDLFAAAEVGNSLPLHMIGERSVATTVPASRPGFGVPNEWRADADRQLYSTIRTMAGAHAADSWVGRIGQAQVDGLDVATTLSPVIPADNELPSTEIVAKLEIAARLINANLGFRVVTAGFGDFDSHAGQPGQHPLRMQELNSAIEAFFGTLDPTWAGSVTVMTFSEFGRTSFANDGQGTDHGSSAPHFVFGANVKGGFYGQRPSLATSNGSAMRRWDRMDTHVDMRDYYGSVIDGWLGGGASTVLPGARENLGLFSSGPSTGGSTPVFQPPAALGEFVGMAPERLYDSRTGVGGRSTRIGPGETVRIPIAGTGSVPGAGITAVAVNITSIRPGTDTFMTAFPSGQSQPDSSTLNPRAGAIVPNTTIVGVGSDGTFSLYNDRSDVDITVDVMGYFDTGGDSGSTSLGRLLALTPARILDTRSGVGAARARASGGDAITLQVLGQGGVPADVDAVVVNLLSINPTADGWVTAWPSGSDEPETASLSYRAGRVIPNLTICKVGPDGTIQVKPSHGQLHLVADVVGCFTNAGAQLSPVAPSRLLDTRLGTGAPQARIAAGGEISLRVTGNGVPSNATAVALNVSAVRPSAQTFLTIYPDGETRPTASSLNPDPGAVSANLVIAKVGDGGRIRIFNDSGDVDLLADLTAYFI